jgi:hypothetical protein
VIARQYSCLQLADAVQKQRNGTTGLFLEMPLELLLVEPGFIEAAESRREAAERPD